MEHNVAESEAKVEEYLETVQRYIVTYLQRSEKRQSCIVVLFLVFAGIDGLGKLVHPNDEAGVGERFKAFLLRLGPGYCDADVQERLYKLRCDLMHNVLHSAAFLSAIASYGSMYHHLARTSQGSIYVNTEALYSDFCDAFQKLKIQFTQDKLLLNQASGRLKRECFDPAEEWGDTTPPGPVNYVS